MKINRMITSGAIVLSIVYATVAFKPVGAGSIYCFANAVVPSVNPALSCNNVMQPASTKIDWTLSNNPIHTALPPCPMGTTAFDGSKPNQCIQIMPGSTRFVSTLP